MSTSTTVQSVSYEKFAPRSNTQLSRLSRIAALTAGPIATTTSDSRAGTSGTDRRDDYLTNKNKNFTNDTRSDEYSNSNNDNDNNNIFVDIMSFPKFSNNERRNEFKKINTINSNKITNNDVTIDTTSTTTSTTTTSTTIEDNPNLVVIETIRTGEELIYQMKQQLKHTTSLRMGLRASINIAEDISNRHAELIRHSGELSAAADRLQEEEAALTRHADEIGMPLQHYDAVDRIGVIVGVLFKGDAIVRGLAKVKVDNDDFPDVLNDIDMAVDFFGTECGGKQALILEEEEMKKKKKKNQHQHQQQQQPPLQSGSLEYFRRSLVLQEAALDLIKEAVAERITNTTSQIIAALNLNSNSSSRSSNSSTRKSGNRGGGMIVQADQLEASLIYTRFHGISARSNRLLSLVRARINRGEPYHELLQHCRTTYCISRELLLRNPVRAHMDMLKEQHGPVGMTRLASVFLIRLCTIETALYLDFFGDKKEVPPPGVAAGLSRSSVTTGAVSDTKSSSRSQQILSESDVYGSGSIRKDTEYQAFLTSLCSELHRTVRRSLVTMVDLDTLCQIVGVLREERSLASSSPTTIAAARAMSSVIADAQERLIFCATSTLTKDVIRFKATAEDLNYPDKLIKKKKQQQQLQHDSAVVTEGAPDVDPVAKDGVVGEDAAAAAPPIITSQQAAAADDDDAVAKQLQQVYDSWFPPMRTVLRILSKVFRVVETRVFEDMALQSVQSCTKCLKDAARYIHSHKGQMHSDLFLVKHLLILREQLSPFDIELRSVERQLDFSDAGKAVARFLANRNRRLFSMSTENAIVTLLREGVSVQESAVDSKRDLEDALRSSCNEFIEHTSSMVASDLLAVAELYKISDAMSLGQNNQKIQADFVLNLLTKTYDSAPVTLQEITYQMSLYLDNPATQNILLKPVCKKITRAIDEIRKVIAQISTNNANGWDSSVVGIKNVDGDDVDGSAETKIEKFNILADSLEKAIKKATKVVSGGHRN